MEWRSALSLTWKIEEKWLKIRNEICCRSKMCFAAIRQQFTSRNGYSRKWKKNLVFSNRLSLHLVSVDRPFSTMTKLSIMCCCFLVHFRRMTWRRSVRWDLVSQDDCELVDSLLLVRAIREWWISCEIRKLEQNFSSYHEFTAPISLLNCSTFFKE